MHVSIGSFFRGKTGQFPSGGDCIINKVAFEADLLISEGFIEAHFLQDSLEEENLCCQALHLIKQLWQITVVNLSMIKCHVQEI